MLNNKNLVLRYYVMREIILLGGQVMDTLSKIKDLLEKILLYSSFRSIKYVLSRPTRINYYLSLLLRSKTKAIIFVSTLLDMQPDEIEEYLPRGNTYKILKRAFKASIAPSSNEMPMNYEECLATYLCVRILKPKVVIETGVSAGRSTAFILAALEDNGVGELFSIDPDPKAGYAVPSEIKHRWHFINDYSENVLEDLLKELKNIDIFLHDSLHTYSHMMYEYTTAWPYIRVGGILLSDDIGLNYAFKHFYHLVRSKGRAVTMDNDFGGIIKLST